LCHKLPWLVIFVESNQKTDDLKLQLLAARSGIALLCAAAQAVSVDLQFGLMLMEKPKYTRCKVTRIYRNLHGNLTFINIAFEMSFHVICTAN